MSNNRRNLIFVCACLLILIVFIANLMAKMTRNYDAACANITEIAKNTDKVKYIENWVGVKLNDKQFIESLGKKRRVDLNDYPDLIDLIGIDWAYLGLEKESAFISINRSFTDRENYMDVKKIKSVSIGQGRLSIIIKLSDLDDLGLEWPADTLKHIVHVNDRVLVYCGN